MQQMILNVILEQYRTDIFASLLDNFFMYIWCWAFLLTSTCELLSRWLTFVKQETLRAGKLNERVLKLFVATGKDEVLSLIEAFNIQQIVTPVLPTSKKNLDITDVLLLDFVIGLSIYLPYTEYLMQGVQKNSRIQW